MKIFLSFLFVLCGLSESHSQLLEKVIVKNIDPYSIEEYYVLADKRSIKHGEYIKKASKNKIIEKGYFSENLKDSSWIYFNGKDTSLIRHFKKGIPVGLFVKYAHKGKISFIFDFSNNKVLSYYWNDTPNKFPILINNQWIKDSIDSPPLILSNETPLNKIVQILRYPKEAEENGISGKVLVAFIVDSNGNMSNMRILESVDPLLDTEALRVIYNIINTKWFPAIKNGVPVTIECFLPVNFILG